jgi:hypothetical protein
VDIDEWLENSEPTIACNQRFTLHGAIATPCAYTQVKSLLDVHEANLVIGKEQGLQIHIDDQKIRLGSAEASEALALASKVKDELEKFRATYNAHVHPAPHGSLTASQIVPISDIGTQC